MKYVHVDEEGRVIAHTESEENPDPEYWSESPWETIPPEFDDWLYIDGELVLDPRDLPPVSYTAEQVLAVLLQETEVLENLPDSALEHMASYMAPWEINHSYIIGDKVQYDDRPYRCVQPHTSTQEWSPDVAVSLWARIIASDDPDNPLPWEQPGSTNPYMTGDKVTHNGHTWISDIDYNVYEPGVAGWTCLDPDSEPEPIPDPEPEPESTPEPEPELSDYDVWVQPGSTNPYKIGDRVHFPTADDPVYESDYDNNIWAPNVFGWHVVEAD